MRFLTPLVTLCARTGITPNSLTGAALASSVSGGALLGLFPDRPWALASAARSESDPLESLHEARRRGESLILFPEGTRGEPEVLGRFRSGAARLQAAPEAAVRRLAEETKMERQS